MIAGFHFAASLWGSWYCHTVITGHLNVTEPLLMVLLTPAFDTSQNICCVGKNVLECCKYKPLLNLGDLDKNNKITILNSRSPYRHYPEFST